MIENSGFAAFAMFHALKLHFSGDSYDYVKYNGKTNVSKVSFSSRKDKFTFYRLSRKFNLLELKDYYVANFIAEDVQWVGDIIGPNGEDNYKKWQKRTQSLTKVFEDDIIHLFEASSNCLHVDNGNYPYLLVQLMQGKVSLETVCIMNDIMNFLPMWKKKILDDIVWPMWCRRIVKYKPFIVFDKNKLKTVLRESYKEYAET